MYVDRRALGVLLALVVVTGCRESSQASPVEPGPVIAGLAEQCPDPATPIPYPADGRVPEGAVGVRLCNGVEFGGRLDLQFDIDAPADELTTDVEDVIGVVNSSQPTPPEGVCPLDAGADLVFWFRYPDDTARAVRYERYGCRDIAIGAAQRRQGGEDLHQAFSDLLLRQREGMQAPDGTSRPDCAQPDQLALNTALDITESVDLDRVAICLDVPDENGSEWQPMAELAPRQVQRLEDDYRLSKVSDGMECRREVFTRILAFTTWGDRVDLWGGCWNYEVPTIRRPGGRGFLAYQPSPGVQRMLERLIARR
jgi:hypothetical protein